MQSITKKVNDFYKTPEDQPHFSRAKAILQKHPEIATLMSNNPFTFIILLGIIALQTSLAIWLGGMAWWWALIVAYVVGAFANHALYVIIHEATHNLIFKNRTLNKVAGVMADLANVVPAAMAFRTYHIKHHAHQGDHDLDADMASYWEARLVGNSWWRKSLWLLLFPVFQALRPPRLKSIRLFNRWILLNIICMLAFDAAIIYFFGINAFLYFIFSFFFSIGLHPVGARWIQEHYTKDGEQETFSYYGWLNIPAMNVGYHNEHHDFPAIPWNNLPKVKAMAPEFYDTLAHHTSWTRLLLDFIFNPKYDLFARVQRQAAQ